MKSTSTVAVIIHAVLAGSSLGGSAARAAGAWSSSVASNTGNDLIQRRIIMVDPPCFFIGFFRCTAAPAGRIPQLLYVFSVEAVLAAGAVGEPVFQRQAHGAERNVLPGDLRFIEQRDLEALDAGPELEVRQASPVEQ